VNTTPIHGTVKDRKRRTTSELKENQMFVFGTFKRNRELIPYDNYVPACDRLSLSLHSGDNWSY